MHASYTTHERDVFMQIHVTTLKFREIHLAVLVQYRRMTDGQTDRQRQTHDDSIYRANYELTPTE